MASFSLHGIPVSRGIAIGRAHLLKAAAREVKHYLVPEEKVEAEVRRLSDVFGAGVERMATPQASRPPVGPAGRV